MKERDYVQSGESEEEEVMGEGVSLGECEMEELVPESGRMTE